MKEAFEKIKAKLHKEDLSYMQQLDVMECIDNVINQVAEEYVPDINVGENGWIPVSERLPEEKENPVTKDYYVYPVMVDFEDIIDIRYYSFGNGHWHHGPGIMDRYVTHWMDIKPLPDPYKGKEQI